MQAFFFSLSLFLMVGTNSLKDKSQLKKLQQLLDCSLGSCYAIIADFNLIKGPLSQFSKAKQQNIIKDVESLNLLKKEERLKSFHTLLIAKYNFNTKKCYDPTFVNELSLDALILHGYASPLVFIPFYTYLLSLIGFKSNLIETQEFRFIKVYSHQEAKYIDIKKQLKILSPQQFVSLAHEINLSSFKAIEEKDLLSFYLNKSLATSLLTKIEKRWLLKTLLFFDPQNLDYSLEYALVLNELGFLLDAFNTFKSIISVHGRQKIPHAHQLLYYELKAKQDSLYSETPWL